MNATGDTKHLWNVADPDEARQAAEMFDLYKQQGYAIFAVEDDQQGTPVKDFDASLGSMLFVPIMAGG
jgi:hypothetical protein